MLFKVYYWLRKVIAGSSLTGEYSSGIWQEEVRAKAADLCKDSNGLFLEVGCGEGLFLEKIALINKSVQIYGVDNCNERIERARKRIKKKNIADVRLFLSNGEQLPFKDNYFDVIVCVNVIFNLSSFDHVGKILNEIKRVCKKNGKITFDFRNKRNPLVNMKYKLAPSYDPTVKHLPLKTYNLGQIKRQLNVMGLQIIKINYIGFFLDILAPIILLEARKE